MRSTYIASSVRSTLFHFAPCFSAPCFEGFAAFVVGWLLCQGSHTISGALMCARSFGLWRRHHSAFYRLLADATWCADEVGCVLLRMLLPFVPGPIDAAIDDTLCHRSGPQLFGAGMHRDAARSSYGGGGGGRVGFAFGHSWVVLSIWVPCPWNPLRGLAVPILFRLYRPKKRCPASAYRKRTELAAEMLDVLLGRLPEGRVLHLAADREYGCRTLLRSLHASVVFAGVLPKGAALFDPIPLPRRPGRGRAPIKGRRLPTPAEAAAAQGAVWERATVTIYGRHVELLLQTFLATWWEVTGATPLRVVLTRDPSGRLADRAYFCTAAGCTAADVLQRYARRWSLEVAFAAAKQSLGLEGPQNGWGRRPHGRRRPWMKSGPQARGQRGRRAVERTVPLIFAAYGVVIAWYLVHGQPNADVNRARRLRPWDRQKSSPSYADMLAALRRTLWRRRISPQALLKAPPAKFRALLAALESAA